MTHEALVELLFTLKRPKNKRRSFREDDDDGGEDPEFETQNLKKNDSLWKF